MQLLRMTDVALNRRAQVFYHSRLRASAGGTIALAAGTGLLGYAWIQSAWLAYFGAAAILSCLLIFHQLILARFRPSNWLVRLEDDGLFVKFRSYLNDRFPEYDPTVVFLPYAEIRSAKFVREKREVEDLSEHTAKTTKIRKFVELEVSSDCRQLSEELVKEHERVAKGKAISIARYGDFPVRVVAPNRVQIDWTVVPPVQALLDALTRHTLVRPAETASKDLAQFDGLSQEQQKAKLLDLVQGGDKITAIAMARKLYGYDLAQAKEFIEDLLSKQPWK
ncbi:MAG: hypothetical protein EXR70_21155 [Deltaproteobacteria bacterium]|nr:hypothetical protein [Deltaproteobacteria bacterium]